jgi:hypothetical protein
VSLVAYIIAILLFLLAGFGVSFDTISSLEIVFFGLAAFALGHVLPASV